MQYTEIDGRVFVFARNVLTGLSNTMSFNCSLADFEKAAKVWDGGELVQNAFPFLDADEREFLLTGITPDEWAATFDK